MKNLFLTFAFLTLPILANAQTTNYSVGDVVDDFTVVDTEGVEHNLYSITASGLNFRRLGGYSSAFSLRHLFPLD